jgi:uncharacterized coiled-coil DUF342 family protein
MSSEKQDETSQQVAELTAELAEVREKRDELQAMNLRVTDNLRRKIEERDNAVAQLESLRAEYLAAKEAANTNSDNAAALREQVAGLDVALRDMTARRDKAAAQWVECCEDRSRHVTSLREQLAEMTAERDKLMADLREQLAAKSVIIAERDAAERERTESRAEVVRLNVGRDNFERLCEEWRIAFDALNAKKDGLQCERDAALAERDATREQLWRAKEVADMLAAENASLQDTIRELSAKQVHVDVPPMLLVIERLAAHARELIG